MNYNIFEPWKTLDPWQKKYIETEGNCFLLCGRQSGKTAAMSIKFGERAATKPNKIIGMFAYTEKQAFNLFFKTLMYLKAKHPNMIVYGKDKPTKHVINLKNGSKIMCYAVGIDGSGIRTFTLTDLVIDEAAPMAREVFIALTPMLSVTGGTLDISSTPRGKAGYFYECSDQCPKVRKNFTRFYISAEDCPRHTKEYLEDEKATMTKLEYAQEYLAHFLDDVRRLFPDELIKSIMIAQRKISNVCVAIPLGDNVLGVDVARMGRDDTVLFSLARINREILREIDLEILKKKLLTETVRIILAKDNQFNYRKIYIDSTGMGWGVFDPLLEDRQTKRKVVSIENASKSLDTEGRKKKIFKEDLYFNLKNLMEKKQIELKPNKETELSLASIQYDEETQRIFGSDDDIAQALVNAAWYMKDKHLKPYIN